MFMGLGMPIPDLSNKPGPGRPGWSAGSYDFQFEVAAGQVGITVLPYIGGQGFTIKWQNGTEQFINAGTTNLQSPTTDAGIISINKKTDQGFCDDFAVVSGKEFVTKVISWGQNPWNRLQDAFKDCTNLTEISTTSLITDTTGNLNNLFSGCTSLTDVSIKGWNLLSGCSIEGLFDGCTNIEKLEATGLAVKIRANSRFAFRQVGSNVTNGCEFLMSGLDFSTSTAMQLGDALERGMFKQVKIKPNSNFSNWNLTSSVNTIFNFAFADAKLLGDNSTLNVYNWTFAGDTNSTVNGFFENLETSDSTNRGLNVDITNWNFGNVVSASALFKDCDLSTVTGLSTLTASNFTNVSSFFNTTRFLSISSSDNLSSSFRNAVNVTGSGISYFAQNLGNALANESDWGVVPNLDGMNLSNSTSFTGVFGGGRYSTGINLGNVTFPTVARSYATLFKGTRLSAGNGIDLTTTTLKSSSFQQTFQETSTDFVKMGPGIDWSSVTVMFGFNHLFNSFRPGGAVANSIELPTGLNISSLSNIGLWGIDANYSQCQIDNFVRSMWLYQRPPLPSTPTLNFSGLTGLTAAPMDVRSKVDDLITAGWNFSGEVSPDITAPFAYTGSFLINTDITPTINTSGGTFSSSDVTVNATTGTFNSSTAVNATIRYTFPDGCYTEQAISLVSAGFSYSASAYCQDAATDPIPTVTGTSGGIFTAVLKVIPFQMQFEVASNTEKIIEVSCSSTGNFTIDWGDNSTILNNYTTGVITHTYNAGNSGTTIDPVISFGDTNDTGVLGDASPTNTSKPSLIDVPQWGNMEFNIYAFQDRFKGCSNSRFQISATDAPNIATGVVNMKNLFYYANPAFNSDISHWNANVGASFSYAFSPITSFNQPLNSWDVSNATTLHSAFYDATSFNQPLNSWDVSNVLGNGLTSLFYRASSFNQYLGDWDIQTSGLNFFRSSGMSTANYTDTFVSWANKVYNNSGPYNLNFGAQVGMTFDRSRSGGSNFADAGAARDYLTGATANWTITSDQEIN